MNKLEVIEHVASSPVIAIPPAYNKYGKLDWKAICGYIEYLEKNGAKTIMTTAGTSQYNLLSEAEIIDLQKFCAANFSGVLIMGLPPVSTKKAIELMGKVEEETPNAYWMALYPDRYYGNENIVEYFHTLADSTSNPMFIHGMFMRNGLKGGMYNFTSTLINEIVAHENIIGIKEETMEMGAAYNVVRKIVKEDFVTIVAGGSMRRHLFLNTTRSKVTFLSGVGNFWPNIEQNYLDYIRNGELEKAKVIVKEYEDHLFDVFMGLGWHRSLRTGLKILGPYRSTEERKPFSELDYIEEMMVAEVLGILGAKHE